MAFDSIDNILVEVKSHEVQRGMFAEMRGDRVATARHLLAAAHLELVLADDYCEAGQHELGQRSRISAASCLWRAGERKQALEILDALMQEEPSQIPVIQELVNEMEERFPGSA